MDQPRRLAIAAGTLYLVTVLTSIPALALKAPLLGEPASLAGAAGHQRLVLAAVLEIVLAFACLGTAIALLPIVRRVDEAAAFGFVGSRTLEAMTILVGVVAMLTLLRVPPGVGVGEALIGLHDWAFLIGPGLIPAVNALLLAPPLYRSRLVPRALPMLGLVGAPLLIGSVLATLLGLVDQVSPLAGLAALPIAAWEIGLGLWLVAKGFRSEAITRLDLRPSAQ